jgi:hypothetical protein
MAFRAPEALPLYYESVSVNVPDLCILVLGPGPGGVHSCRHESVVSPCWRGYDPSSRGRFGKDGTDPAMLLLQRKQRTGEVSGMIAIADRKAEKYPARAEHDNQLPLP